MVAGIGLLDTGGRYSHVDQAKAYGQPTRYVSSVRWVNEIHLGIRSRWMPTRNSGCGGVANPDPDAIGHDWRRMRHVPLVSQQELERMLSGRQAHFSLSLAGTKMQVREVIWNRLIERGQLGIDQQMMVSRVLSIGARRGYSHAAKPEVDDRFGRQCVAILDVYEIDGSARGGRRGSTARRGLAMSGAAGRNPDQDRKRDRFRYL